MNEVASQMRVRENRIGMFDLNVFHWLSETSCATCVWCQPSRMLTVSSGKPLREGWAEELTTFHPKIHPGLSLCAKV